MLKKTSLIFTLICCLIFSLILISNNNSSLIRQKEGLERLSDFLGGKSIGFPRKDGTNLRLKGEYCGHYGDKLNRIVIKDRATFEQWSDVSNLLKPGEMVSYAKQFPLIYTGKASIGESIISIISVDWRSDVVESFYFENNYYSNYMCELGYNN